MTDTQSPHLNRSLGPWQAASIVVGTVVGTGIFLKTATMSQELGSMGMVLLAWIVAGVLSYAGALTYAELCCHVPSSGGEYAILKTAYGPLAAFLYGWMRFWIGAPGSIAAYAVGTATFSTSIFSSSALPGGTKGVAVILILLFSAVNCLKITWGARVQTLLTLLKVALIIGLVAGIFFFAGPAASTQGALVQSNPLGTFKVFGLALIAALWAYDGWNNLPMVGDEIKNPQKNFPIALGLGMLAVIALYGILNWAYFYTLTTAEIQSANSTLYPDALPVATLAAKKFLGEWGIPLLSISFVISAVGAMNGSILTGARVPFAMAQDGLFWKSLSRVHPQSCVPVNSVLLQAVVSVLLALSGTFDQLTDYVVIASWVFYALNCGALFILRKRPEFSQSTFRVPGGAIVPVLFILASLLLVGNSAVASPQNAFVGGVLLALGIPVYWVFKRRNSK